jgi:UDP-glucose 6-dehydrogenase
MKVGIYGYGVIGQALHSIFVLGAESKAVIYDKYKPQYFHTRNEILTTDMVFVCVPTPKKSTGEFNDIHIKETLEFFAQSNYQGIVVVKSTTVYKVVADYIGKLKLVINPEFLRENSAFEDIKNENTVVLGGDYNNAKEVYRFYAQYTKLRDIEPIYCSIEDAINVKYIRNIYGAYKVLFWEFVQDITGNEEKIYDIISKLPPQGDMAVVGKNGYRGYGGACFPKDVAAYSYEFQHDLLKFMEEFNSNLKKS